MIERTEESRPCIGRNLGALQSKTFDLAIVGGGITGVGIARHAAASGLDVVIIEAADYGSGTSSKSTKLIHGGLRYLAMGDIKLVREAARERKNVHRLAPHLAEPMTMVMPVRNRWQWLKYKLGLSLYDFLGRVGREDRHQEWNSSVLAAEEPALRSGDFPYCWAYREYVTDDARLVLAVLREAIGNGAEAANYVRVESIEQRRDQYFLHSRDMQGNAELAVRCRCVVNAAGPWAEQVLHGQVGNISGGTSATGECPVADPPVADPSSLRSTVDGTTSRLFLSKGVHIAVPRERLAINNMIFLHTKDKRVIFAIPRGQVTYIGTTDTFYEHGPERWPVVTEEDIHYLLDPLSRYFVGEPLTPADVVSTWAGLRPLINQPGKAAKEMSRKDEIWRDHRGVITIAGGKLTGFRLMAEEVMAYVADSLEREIRDQIPLDALPGGVFVNRDMAAEDEQQAFAPLTLESEIRKVSDLYRLGEATAGRLVRLYGSEVEAVLGASPSLISNSVFVEEVDWAIDVDGALSLEDVLYRRLRCVWYEPKELTELLPAISERMAERLGWDAREQHRQRVAAEERIAFDLAAVPVPT